MAPENFYAKSGDYASPRCVVASIHHGAGGLYKLIDDCRKIRDLYLLGLNAKQDKEQGLPRERRAQRKVLRSDAAF
jgi:hypothetical protein